MMNKRIVLVAGLLLGSTASNIANAEVLLGSGVKGGTYDTVANELMAQCSRVPVAFQNTKGAVDNVDLTTKNKIDGGIIQGDVAAYKNFVSPASMKNMRVLFPMHLEEVHVVTLAVNSKIRGAKKFGGLKDGDLLTFSTIADLNGQPVAAWGGSTKTVEVMAAKSGLTIALKEVPGFPEAQAALDSGAVAAIVMVGGQPYGPMEKLNKNYKLITVPESQGKLADTYMRTVLSYDNIASGDTASIATTADLMVYNNDDPEFAQEMFDLRNCFLTAVPKLARTRGTHPSWRAMDVNRKSKWQAYEFPANMKTSAAAVVEPAKKK